MYELIINLLLYMSDLVWFNIYWDIYWWEYPWLFLQHTNGQHAAHYLRYELIRQKLFASKQPALDESVWESVISVYARNLTRRIECVKTTNQFDSKDKKWNRNPKY